MLSLVVTRCLIIHQHALPRIAELELLSVLACSRKLCQAKLYHAGVIRDIVLAYADLTNIIAATATPNYFPCCSVLRNRSVYIREAAPSGPRCGVHVGASARGSAYFRGTKRAAAAPPSPARPCLHGL